MSVLNPDALMQIKPLHEAATRGTIVHSLAADYGSTGLYDVGSECLRHGWPEAVEEVAELTRYAVEAFDELKKYLPSPQFEVGVAGRSLYGVSITGTIDVLSPLEGNAAIFIDYKTGYVDEGYHQQMFGYAYALWCECGRPDDFEITGVVVFLRHRYYRIVKYTAAKVAAWENDLLRNVLASPVYRPSRACRNCKLYHSCPARKTVVGGMIDALIRGSVLPDDDQFKQYLAEAKSLLSALTPENKHAPAVTAVFNDLIYICKLVEQQVQETRSMLRLAVEQCGPVRLSETTELGFRTVNRRDVDPEKALPVLRAVLADSQICEAMKLSLPQLEDIYASMHQRGGKGKAKKELEASLINAGAVQVTPQPRLEEMDVTPPETTSNVNTDTDATQPVGPDSGEGASVAAGDGQREAGRSGSDSDRDKSDGGGSAGPDPAAQIAVGAEIDRA